MHMHKCVSECLFACRIITIPHPSVHVIMLVHMCACVGVHMHVHTRICTHACGCAHACALALHGIPSFMSLFLLTTIIVRPCARVRMCMRVHVLARACVCMCVHIRARMDACKCDYACVSVCGSHLRGMCACSVSFSKAFLR